MRIDRVLPKMPMGAVTGREEKEDRWMCPRHDPWIQLARFHFLAHVAAATVGGSAEQLEDSEIVFILEAFPAGSDLGPEAMSRYKYDGDAYIMEMAKKQVRTFLDVAWTMLTEEQRTELAQRFYTSMVKQLGNGLEPRTKEAIMQFAMTIANEELDRRTEEIRRKVTSEIDARWEKMVENLVAARLADAVAKIKAEMVRP